MPVPFLFTNFFLLLTTSRDCLLLTCVTMTMINWLIGWLIYLFVYCAVANVCSQLMLSQGDLKTILLILSENLQEAVPARPASVHPPQPAALPSPEKTPVTPTGLWAVHHYLLFVCWLTLVAVAPQVYRIIPTCWYVYPRFYSGVV